MVNNPKRQLLRERIEKTRVLDAVDSDLEGYYNELIRSLRTIGPVEPFNLLTPESARAAEMQLTAKLEKLQSLGKQIKAVTHLLNQQRDLEVLPVDEPPDPDLGGADSGNTNSK